MWNLKGSMTFRLIYGLACRHNGGRLCCLNYALHIHFRLLCLVYELKHRLIWLLIEFL